MSRKRIIHAARRVNVRELNFALYYPGLSAMGRPLDHRLMALVAVGLMCPLAARSQSISNRSEASGHHRQGLFLYQSNDPVGAIRELEVAVKIDPGYAEAWNDL